MAATVRHRERLAGADADGECPVRRLLNHGDL
jgi:hypothetical protein